MERFVCLLLDFERVKIRRGLLGRIGQGASSSVSVIRPPGGHVVERPT